MFRFYKVGGCVRDALMGLKSKDIDYTVVPEDAEMFSGVDGAFEAMQQHLEGLGFHIWQSTPDCSTIRAKFPEDSKHAGLTADFVLSRKEIGYIKGTRKPIVELGTLYDDLARRDFTVNAIAQEEEDGAFIDPFGGLHDIKKMVLRTPLPVYETFDDDPLRILRGVRFAVTKGFYLAADVRKAINNYDYRQKMYVVSEERIREELFKMMKHDTLKSLQTLIYEFPELGEYIFKKTQLWLKPTNEK